MEDLINRFKSESKFDTMNKGKRKAQSNETGGKDKITAKAWADVDQIDLDLKISLQFKECEAHSRSNDLNSTNNGTSEEKIQIVKILDESQPEEQFTSF